MKIGTIKTFALLGVFSLAFAQILGVFAEGFETDVVAAGEDFRLSYSGGEDLGSNGNVIINESLVNGLEPLIKFGDSEGNDVKVSGSTWESGYIITGNNVCREVSYFKTRPGSDFGNDLSYSISKNQYKINVGFSGIQFDGSLGDNEYVSVAVSPDNGGIYVGFGIFASGECKEGDPKDPTIKPMPKKIEGASDFTKVFIKTDIKLYENEKILVDDGIYFGITDIDAGQSYKILNSDNKLASDNMYAKSSAGLQPSDPTSTLKNKYNASGNYIYSQYNKDGDGKGFDIGSGADVFVGMKSGTLENGLDFVFGFVGKAGSGVEYYAKQFVVKYVSDKNGSITGTEKENIISGRNPSGSTSKPKENFEFAHWEADVDVTLIDGTVIKAGNKLSPDQVKKVVVDRDITFTAIHEDVPENNNTNNTNNTKVPDTGDFTSNESLAPVVLSVFGIVLSALAIWSLPRIVHKKVKFD